MHQLDNGDAGVTVLSHFLALRKLVLTGRHDSEEELVSALLLCADLHELQLDLTGCQKSQVLELCQPQKKKMDAHEAQACLTGESM